MWFWHHHNHHYNLSTAFNIFFFPRVRFPITFLFEISSSCLWTEGLPSWPQPAPVKAQRLASAVGCLLVCWADVSVYFLILFCLLLRHCSLLAVAVISCCLLPFCFLFCHFSPVVCCHLICFVSISVCCCHFPVCVLSFLSVNCRLFRCVVPTLSTVSRIFCLAVRCPYLSSVSQKISVKTQSLLSVPSLLRLHVFRVRAWRFMPRVRSEPMVWSDSFKGLASLLRSQLPPLACLVREPPLPARSLSIVRTSAVRPRYYPWKPGALRF